MISYIVIWTGLGLLTFGTLGIIFSKNTYTKLLYSTFSDTVGTALITVGLMVKMHFSSESFKLLLIFFLILIISPTVTQIIGKSKFTNEKKK